MKIIFRATAIADLKWFRRYYTTVFPEGAKHAKIHYNQSLAALLAHSFVGHPLGDDTPLRELVIPRTNFSFVYHIVNEEIIVVRILDARAERPSRFGI
jgi:plasmid stabilization system protein ParE